MKPTVLLTLGRLPKGLDIARSFYDAGWRVIVAEPFGWHLCGLSRAVAKSVVVPAPNVDVVAYRAALLAIIAQEGVSLIVPVSEETMHVVGLEGHLPEGVRLFADGERHTLDLHDKAQFAQRLRDAGLAAPSTALLGTSEAEALVREGPVVIKDRWGASGSHVSFLAQGATLPDRPNTLVQQQLVGDEVSSFSIAHGGRISVTVVYRPVIRDGTVSTVFERIDAPDVSAYVAQIAELTGHNGFLSFDMMATDQGPVAFECNPRANSGVHFLETTDVAPAILDPHFTPRVRTSKRMQQAYPTLTLLWGAIGRWPRYRAIAKALFTSQDVTWQWSDPLPFLLMTPATWPILRQAMFDGRTLGEAAIHDIGWFGPAT